MRVNENFQGVIVGAELTADDRAGNFLAIAPVMRPCA
jgi:hypothetical protein